MKRPDRTIAIVDDEDAVRVALGRVLRLEGYEVVSFESGEALLASLATRIPACAVIDVHLPGLSGFDVERRVRATHPGVGVVFITASDDLALTRGAEGARGARLLRKPFSSDALLEAVADALSDSA